MSRDETDSLRDRVGGEKSQMKWVGLEPAQLLDQQAVVAVLTFVCLFVCFLRGGGLPLGLLVVN